MPRENCENLSNGDQNAEYGGVAEAHHAVEPCSEGEAADRAEQRLPGQRIVTFLAGHAVELDRDGDAGRGAGGKPEEQAEPKAVADSEHDGISDHPGQQPQRTVLAAQQVIGQIEAAEHVETGAGDADGGDCVMVHFSIVEAWYMSAPGGFPSCVPLNDFH